MPAALKAGIVYFLIAFAAGFALGTLRTLVIAPAIGEVAAVALELPIMLAISWFACGWVLRQFALPPEPGGRLVMGVTALALLLAAEAGVSVLLAGRSLGEHFTLYRQAPALLGLFGQIAFALFPVLRKNVPEHGNTGRLDARYG
jgi:hypothetical protein